MHRTILVVSRDVGFDQVLAGKLNEITMGRTDDARYTIMAASDGAKALDEVKNRCIDLIVTEAASPGLDGFQLVEAARETGCPGLLLSAEPISDEIFLRAHVAGAVALRQKPGTDSEWDELADTIRRICRSSNGGRGIYDTRGTPGDIDD